MAIYYKFKSAKDYDSIAIDGHFIPVGNLKEKIFENKHLGRGTDFDLVITNSQTNEEYLDEAELIPKNTSVLIRRVPGRPRMPIVAEPVVVQEQQMESYKSDEVPVAKSNLQGNDSSAIGYPDDLDWDEFGSDLYSIPEVRPLQSSNHVQEAPLPSIDDEDSKIKALIDTPALDWQSQSSDGFGGGRGFGRGMGGRMMAGRGFGGRGGFERKTPPQGYICYRCKVPGHYIQHCPTNGDPNFDIRRVKPPTGIPKSMLMATPDGSYALPSGAVAVLKPNEAAFEKEIEGMPSTRSVGDLPPELHCPLCKEVMKDAVLTSKCCFTSFCDKCIRDFIISKSMCTCGASNVLADDLLPNKTLRDTINRILESNNDSAENAGSAFQAQDMESKIPQVKEPKVPSPTVSATSKGQQAVAPVNNVLPRKEEISNQGATGGTSQVNLGQGSAGKLQDKTDAVHDSLSMKEPASQGSAPLADEEVQQKPASSDAGKKKGKKKKARLPVNATDMQWKGPQDPFGLPENYMMPMNPGPYNPYWNGMQPGLDGYGAPFGGPMPYMGYGLGPLDVPFGVMPQDPFGAPAYMMPPVPPQSFGMGFNPGPPPPIMSREEFEARKADLRRKRDFERRGERGDMMMPKDREVGREVSSNGDGGGSSSLRPKHKSTPEQPSNADSHRHRRRSERSPPPPERSVRDPDLPRPPPKRKAEHSDYDHGRKSDRDYDHGRKSDYDDYDHRERERGDRHRHRSDSSSSVVKPSSAKLDPVPPTKSSSDKKAKPSVFSRISFPAEDHQKAASAAGSKKRKVSSSSEAGGGSSTHHSHRSGGGGGSANGHGEEKKSSTVVKAASVSRKSADYESSDDDRHFKRRPSRYESSPAPASDGEEEGRHNSRASRDRSHSKHR